MVLSGGFSVETMVAFEPAILILVRDLIRIIQVMRVIRELEDHVKSSWSPFWSGMLRLFNTSSPTSSKVADTKSRNFCVVTNCAPEPMVVLQFAPIQLGSHWQELGPTHLP